MGCQPAEEWAAGMMSSFWKVDLGNRSYHPPCVMFHLQHVILIFVYFIPNAILPVVLVSESASCSFGRLAEKYTILSSIPSHTLLYHITPLPVLRAWNVKLQYSLTRYMLQYINPVFFLYLTTYHFQGCPFSYDCRLPNTCLSSHFYF